MKNNQKEIDREIEELKEAWERHKDHKEMEIKRNGNNSGNNKNHCFNDRNYSSDFSNSDIF